MDSILELIRQEHQASQSLAASSSSRKPTYMEVGRSPSPEFEIVGTTSKPNANGRPTPASVNGHKEYSIQDRPSAQLRARIDELDAEVLGCRADIEEIQNRINECLGERTRLEKQLLESGPGGGSHLNPAKGKGKAQQQSGINYATEIFDWTDGLKARMRTVFGIKEFRLCQEG